MIFVTVGTHNQGFERLIKEADKAAPELGEDVFIQTGYSNYKPRNCKYKNFLQQQEFENICSRSSVIITHGGIGSIMTPLMMGKKVIVVPRFKKYGEHNDDHQIQITKELESQGKIIAVYEIEKLKDAVHKSKKFKTKAIGKNNRIKKIIENFISKGE